VAKQIITTVLDDLDGSEADETVTFALDGIGYEIDLSGKHALELREYLTRYMDAGTRLGRVEGRIAQVSRYMPQAAKVQTVEGRQWNQKVRTWAGQNGWELSDRGRIPQHVIDAFEQKQPNPAWQQQQQKSKEAKESVDRLAAEAATAPKTRRGRTAA
jgi:hypothetical protein